MSHLAAAVVAAAEADILYRRPSIIGGNRRARMRRSLSCGSGLGHLRDPSSTNADMRELFAFCGQPGLTNHIWHRTVTTIMEPGGLSARAGADQLGHRQVATTMSCSGSRCLVF
jgi:integrase